MTEASPVDLTATARELAAEAADHHSGRAARLVVTGPRMRAVLMALNEGAELAEHESPAAATLQVLAGEVTLHTAVDEWPLSAGQLHHIPPVRHSLLARSAAVVLLTVVLS